MSTNILCIDDIEMNLFTLESVLQTATVRYNVFTALSVHDGFDILLKNRIDLILLDVMMPEVDGFMAAKMLKSNKRTKDIPIIFVTAKKDSATIEKCYEVGGRDYVTKPFNSIELLNRVSLHLRLKSKEKLLKKEKEYAQNILDLQDNFIVVTDGDQVIQVNKSVLDFYDLSSLYDFQKKVGCICNSFKEEDGYFSLSLVEASKTWVDSIISKLENKEDVVVKIQNYLKEDFIFTIKATQFYDYYILTLTDITLISEQSKEFEYAANYDALTHIYNRKAFERLVNIKINECKYKEKKFIFVILDIDFFKKVNDNYGHLAGDDVLKKLVNVVKSHIRDNDIFARIGGEEFVLVLDVDIEQGLKVVEHLRAIIENEDFDLPKHITCSFGVTQYKKNDTIKDMTSRADKALYKAKETGRNKVCQEL